jgi:hypothetical protein
MDFRDNIMILVTGGMIIKCVSNGGMIVKCVSNGGMIVKCVSNVGMIIKCVSNGGMITKLVVRTYAMCFRTPFPIHDVVKNSH